MLLSALGLAACGFSAERDEIGGVMFGFALQVAALAAMIVWLTARDVAADAPPEDRGPRGFQVKLVSRADESEDRTTSPPPGTSGEIERIQRPPASGRG